MKNYLIYHPKRDSLKIGNHVIYHDKFGGNEDPFVWNDPFLHSFCKITGIPKEPGQINFWVSGDIGRDFKRLLCDCVFTISESITWTKPNRIYRNDPIVDSEDAFNYHFKWVYQHPFKKKNRYTLKADSDKSFQPQTNQQVLFDILPFLIVNGISVEQLKKSFFPSWRSKYFELDSEFGGRLFEHIYKESDIKLFGSDLKNLHPKPNNKNNGSIRKHG